MSNIKENVKDAGKKVAETAKDAGKVVAENVKDAAHFVAEKAGQAADWVKEKTKSETCGTAKDDSCGSAKSVADIQPHMDVVSSCGCNMGKVDHLQGSTIKLTKSDSADGKHHFIPTGWVARVDQHVHLSKNAEETMKNWTTEPATAG
jgi:hypothetical protein